MAKVLVAMSGGVDSTVSALLLKEQGYEVIGVTFVLFEDQKHDLFVSSIKKCVSYLAIEHYFVDLINTFKEVIINPFYDAYKAGITPNPCVMCNRLIKFHHLLSEANRIGADYISTGHYASIKNGLLCKALDSMKDQSYALYRLTKEQLQRAVFPLWCFHKKDIKNIALSMGLPSADKKESQEVCFLSGEGYHTFIKDYKDGDIIHIETHKKIGKHKGFYRYTIGQRKRLEVSSQVPLYVADIDVKNNIVYVGSRDNATSDVVKVRDINWLISKDSSFSAHVKIRSTMKEQPALVEYISSQEVVIRFNEPQWAPAGGQSAVFYEGDKVIGGGIIFR